jgi:hypothetical protein
VSESGYHGYESDGAKNGEEIYCGREKIFFYYDPIIKINSIQHN